MPILNSCERIVFYLSFYIPYVQSNISKHGYILFKQSYIKRLEGLSMLFLHENRNEFNLNKKEKYFLPCPCKSKKYLIGLLLCR